MKKNCAPVIVATLNRSQHFIRLIESLKRNTWAQYTDVFVGLDYPPSEKYADGYNQICDYLSGDFPEFASIHVIRREENVGSIKNFALLRDYVLTRYDRFIRTDDDAEFSPNFLEYINKCLDRYESDTDIIAVTGYSYPIDWHVSGNANIFKEDFICPTWGTGFWRDKYRTLCDYIQLGGIRLNIKDFIHSSEFEEMITTSKVEIIELCLSPGDFQNTFAAIVSDISIRMYMAQCKKEVIMPVLSKVRNWGYDGTGEYCQKSEKKGKVYNAYNYPYHLQEIDNHRTFIVKEDCYNAGKQNKAKYDKFDTLPLWRKLKSKLKLIIYRVLGERCYVAIGRIFKNKNIT